MGGAPGWTSWPGPVRPGSPGLPVCDHVAIPKPGAPAPSTTWFDCVATLSYLAALTHCSGPQPRLRAAHRPLLGGQAVDEPDAFRGRAILGVGPATSRASSTRWASTTTRRVRFLDESIDAVRAALTDEFSSHEGDVWSYGGRAHAPAGPVPGADLGAGRRAALRRAAERGDGWLPRARPRRMSAGIARLRHMREAAGAGRTSPSPSALSVRPAVRGRSPLGHRPGGPRLA